MSPRAPQSKLGYLLSLLNRNMGIKGTLILENRNNSANYNEALVVTEKLHHAQHGEIYDTTGKYVY